MRSEQTEIFGQQLMIRLKMVANPQQTEQLKNEEIQLEKKAVEFIRKCQLIFQQCEIISNELEILENDYAERFSTDIDLN